MKPCALCHYCNLNSLYTPRQYSATVEELNAVLCFSKMSAAGLCGRVMGLGVCVCALVKCHRVCFTSSAISALKPCSSPPLHKSSACQNEKKIPADIFSEITLMWERSGRFNHVCRYTPKHTHTHTHSLYFHRKLLEWPTLRFLINYLFPPSSSFCFSSQLPNQHSISPLQSSLYYFSIPSSFSIWLPPPFPFTASTLHLSCTVVLQFHSFSSFALNLLSHLFTFSWKTETWGSWGG